MENEVPQPPSGTNIMGCISAAIAIVALIYALTVLLGSCAAEPEAPTPSPQHCDSIVNGDIARPIDVLMNRPLSVCSLR